jgi:steroid delta-isomerase-like uncharacterized protein
MGSPSRPITVDIYDMVRRRLEAFNRHDVAGLMSCYSDHCIISDPPELPPIRGKKAFSEVMSVFFNAFPDAHLAWTAPLVSGLAAAFQWTFIATQSRPYKIEGLPWTLQPSGRRTETTGASFLEFDSSGRITEQHSYWELVQFATSDLNLRARSDREALSKIRSALRRNSTSSARLVLGDVTVDFADRTAMRGAKRLAVTNRELELLRYLAERPLMVAGRDELLRAVWGYSGGVPTRVVDQTVARLRKTVEVDPRQPRYLHTAHGTGYYLSLHESIQQSNV